MGKQTAKGIRNSKIADILRKTTLVSSPSISLKNPPFGAFKESGDVVYGKQHMGNQDLLPISSISTPAGLNQCSEIFLKVNDDELSLNSDYLMNSIDNSSCLDATDPSVSINLEKSDTIMKFPADAAHPIVHGSASSNSMKSSANSSLPLGPWVNLFKRNRVFSENCGRLKEIQLSNNFVDLRHSVKKNDTDLCLLGSFSTAFPGKDAILKLRNSWKVSCQVHFHASNWLIFKFENTIDLDRVLTGGPYCFFGKPMRIFKMPRFFNFSSELFSIICVWVKLPNLPLKLWNDDDLSSICSYLGKPLYTDLSTKQSLNLDYARCLVEIDTSQKLHNSIPILLADDFVLHQPVVYEDLPSTCSIKSDLVNEMVKENDDAHHQVVNEACKLPVCLQFGSLNFEEAIESCSKNDMVAGCILGNEVKNIDLKKVEVHSLKLKAENLGDVNVEVVSNVAEKGYILLKHEVQGNDDSVEESVFDVDVNVACKSVVSNNQLVGADLVAVREVFEVEDVSKETDFGDEVSDGVENLVDKEEIVDDESAIEEEDEVVADFVESVFDDDAVVNDVDEVHGTVKAGNDDDSVDDESEFDGDSDSFSGNAEAVNEEKRSGFKDCDDDFNSVNEVGEVHGTFESENDSPQDDNDGNDDDSLVDESEFVVHDDSDPISGNDNVVNVEEQIAFRVTLPKNATFEEKIAGCKQAGMNGRVASLGGYPFDFDLDLYDDSGRLLAVAPLMQVHGVADNEMEEFDDEDDASNEDYEDEDNDDDGDASEVESVQEFDLQKYTLKLMKEAKDGGYIPVRPIDRHLAREATKAARAMGGVVLTKDDINTEVELSRLGF